MNKLIKECLKDQDERLTP